MSQLATIGGIAVMRRGPAITWEGPLAIDADGAPTAYHPTSSRGLDNLENAGRPGDWYGLACDVTGVPVIQGSHDPAPGYYVSTTALVDRRFVSSSPHRYVDANKVPFLAIPPDLKALGVRLGDVALVEYQGRSSPAIVADVGPRGHLGEGSIALARALGIPESPRNGGAGGGVRFTVWPLSATSTPWPRSVEGIAREVEILRAQLPPG